MGGGEEPGEGGADPRPLLGATLTDWYRRPKHSCPSGNGNTHGHSEKDKGQLKPSSQQEGRNTGPESPTPGAWPQHPGNASCLQDVALLE
jgi:hypothetical protein